MNINSDFRLKTVINTHNIDWVKSPVQGVERKLLNRIGNEVARATSIVKYSRNSVFTEHTHGGGVEILVLDATFADKHGDYPAGTYLRYPPLSSHSPFSKEGCTLFVKLRQFHTQDDSTVQIDTARASWYQGLVPSLSVMPLHDFDAVGTALVNWTPNTIFNPHVHPGGEEIFVLRGVFHDEHGSYPEGTWIRSPRYSRHAPFTKVKGALIYVKTGHMDYSLQDH